MARPRLSDTDRRDAQIYTTVTRSDCDRIDQLARQVGLTRSSLLRTLVRRVLDGDGDELEVAR